MLDVASHRLLCEALQPKVESRDDLKTGGVNRGLAVLILEKCPHVAHEVWRP